MKNKIILDLCGGTGSWSRPYKKAGYDVRNITLPEYDVRLYEPPKNVYGILAAPPCTMFSFARTNARKPRDLESGMSLIMACLRIIWTCQYRTKSDQQKYSPLKFWCLENPYYAMTKWFLGKPVFVFNPWEFGDRYKKKTSLWGYFDEPKKIVFNDGRKLKKFDKLLMQELKYLKLKAWTEDYINTKTRQAIRAITPAGFALAFYESNK